jgi:hypothetical protein
MLVLFRFAEHFSQRLGRHQLQLHGVLSLPATDVGVTGRCRDPYPDRAVAGRGPGDVSCQGSMSWCQRGRPERPAGKGDLSRTSVALGFFVTGTLSRNKSVAAPVI